MPIYPYSFQLPPLNVQDIPNDGAVGEFLGINVGGVLDWLPVATGGGDMLKSENLSGLADYAIARTNIGLGTASTPTFANLTLTSPSLASSAPVTISQTWNGTGSTVFKALVVNATTPGTTSSFTSLLLDLQVGGATKTSVNKLGEIGAFGYIGLNSSGSAVMQLGSNTASFGYHMARDYCVTWGGAATLNGSIEVSLCRDGAANTLALRNGAAAQTFRVYNTYTDASNYERAAFSWASNQLNIGVDYSGSGVARKVAILGAGIDFNHAGVGTRMSISTAGNVGIGTTAPGAKLQINSPGNSYPTTSVPSLSLRQSNNSSFGFDFIQDDIIDGTLYLHRVIAGISTPILAIKRGDGNVGIGTTSPTSKLHVAETWNNAGTAFCAIKSVITDTNSAAGSDFLELYSGTSTQPLRMGINKTGQINIYGTWTDASNYERLSFSAPTAGNAIIGTNKSGGSSVARGLELQTDGVTRMTISASGLIDCALTFASQASLSSNSYIMWGNGASSRMLAPSNGVIQFTNAATTGFDRLQFGGTTNLFPAIKRSSTTLQARLADDSAFAPVQGKLTTDTDYTATVVTPTGFLTLYDAQGTAYRVPCVLAP